MSQFPFKFIYHVLLLKRLETEGENRNSYVSQLCSLSGCIYKFYLKHTEQPQFPYIISTALLLKNLVSFVKSSSHFSFFQPKYLRKEDT